MGRSEVETAELKILRPSYEYTQFDKINADNRYSSLYYTTVEKNDRPCKRERVLIYMPTGVHGLAFFPLSYNINNILYTIL